MTTFETHLAQARLLFGWNEQQPGALSVVRTSPDEHATDLFSLRADYGWAERSLCDDMYLQDAIALGHAVAAATGASFRPEDTNKQPGTGPKLELLGHPA